MGCKSIEQILDDKLVGELLFGPAQVLPGSALNDDELIRVASETFPDRSFCIVRAWMLIDVILSDRHKRLLRTEDLYPTVLYANRIVYSVDTQGETSHGVLSGFQQRQEDCFFETEEMVYVLAGRGARKRAEMPTFFALAQRCGVLFQEAI